MKTEIIIGQGIQDVKFGMSKEEVKKILGPPNETDKYSYPDSEDNKGESWHYDHHELSCSFDEEDEWKMGTMAVSDPDFSLKGVCLIGLTKEEALKRLTEMKMGELHTEDIAEEGVHLINITDASINLWLDGGVVSEIQWGILWDDEGEPLWPVK